MTLVYFRSGAQGHDIYAVVVQECEYSPKDASYPSCEAEWFEQVRGCLGDYVQLATCTLVRRRERREGEKREDGERGRERKEERGALMSYRSSIFA